jgi:hypothetical protein
MDLKKLKIKLKRWLEKFSDTMLAVSFAEENESEYAKEFLYRATSRIVLLIDNARETPRETLIYAMNLSQNTKTKLVILTMFKESERPNEMNLEREIKNLEMIHPVTGSLEIIFHKKNADLFHFIKNDLKVNTLIMEDPIKTQLDELSSHLAREKRPGKEWTRTLNCPLVIKNSFPHIKKTNSKEEKSMGFFHKFSKIFSAAAFAEAGDYKTACDIMDYEPVQKMKNAKISRFDLHMAAATFAEAGEFSVAQKIMDSGALIKDEKITLENRRLNLVSEKHTNLAAAAALAEEGLHDHAKELLNDEDTIVKKILVIGDGYKFSERIIEYSIFMATKMNCELFLLNILEPGMKMSEVSFQEKAKTSLAVFQKIFREKNLKFQHLVKSGEKKKTIENCCADLRRVAFVLNEAEPEKTEKKENYIPVLSLNYIPTTKS